MFSGIFRFASSAEDARVAVKAGTNKAIGIVLV
jgi:hypothetical protein